MNFNREYVLEVGDGVFLHKHPGGDLAFIDDSATAAEKCKNKCDNEINCRYFSLSQNSCKTYLFDKCTETNDFNTKLYSSQ